MNKQFIYEIFLGLLAIITAILLYLDSNVTLTIVQQNLIRNIDYVILGIFAFDYFFFLYKAENKKAYFKGHIFELIAIIPFDMMFRVFRMVRIIRLFKLFRAFAFIKRTSTVLNGILNTNGLNKVIYFTLFIIGLSSVGIYFCESNVSTFPDAIWWSIVTATTVGYGDISPETLIGRIIAIILMVIGIGLIGMITGSIATFFIKEKVEDINSEIYTINSRIKNLDGLSNEETIKVINDIIKYKNIDF